ncbi:TPA: transcriptional regulator [Streptococcus pyogenes]|uniref:transcriptional regulator n=3 Tax=Streptococcus pyogenes TaxID=1314 RepID=UPI0027DB1BD8|nr:transcriptional regulator [Streptococcus pyogenes]
MMLSKSLQVPLEQLITEDIPKMTLIIKDEEIKQCDRDTHIMLFGTLLIAISIYLIMSWLGWWGYGPVAILWLIIMRSALRIERFKKTYDVQTYR